LRKTPVRHARKRLDLTAADITQGLAACIGSPSRATATEKLAQAWSPADAVVPCLSVRSGFDLLLASMDWPPGSEVLLSAVTIPHLATLVRHHGYTPVALDIDPDTMELDPAEVQAACTPRTRALLFAHLFGARADTSPLAEVANSCGLMFIEDCAQCYDGATRTLGRADIEMYSFGTIKTATCLGGAVLLVRDGGVRRRMLQRQSKYPVQSTRSYAAKLIKSAALVGVGNPAVYPLFTRLLDRSIGDYDRVVRSLTRGFDDRSLLAKIRQQPSTALLGVLGQRFTSYDSSRVSRRQEAGAHVAAALGPEVTHLGGKGRAHTHWLFPVVSRSPAALVRAGRAAGFDLTCGSSTLVALDQGCSHAHHAMEEVVYLPAYAAMPAPALSALAELVNRVERAETGEGPGFPSRNYGRHRGAVEDQQR
jgi:dTDP-4-amino-4,6-dideoxygalactose transaminase